MHFEDYNYDYYNKYILIDPNKIDGESDEENNNQPQIEKPDGMLGFKAPPGGGLQREEEKQTV